MRRCKSAMEHGSDDVIPEDCNNDLMGSKMSVVSSPMVVKGNGGEIKMYRVST